MKNFVKTIAKGASCASFTFFGHYQPKMPKSLMEKIISKNKKEN